MCPTAQNAPKDPIASSDSLSSIFPLNSEICPPNQRKAKAMKTPKLALTMGDPSGIGPEVCLMLQERAREVLPSAQLVIYGDLGVLERVADLTGLPAPDPNAVRTIDSLPGAESVKPGQVAAACGQLYSYWEVLQFVALTPPTAVPDTSANSALHRHWPSIQCGHCRHARALRAPWRGSPSDPLHPY